MYSIKRKDITPAPLSLLESLPEKIALTLKQAKQAAKLRSYKTEIFRSARMCKDSHQDYKVCRHRFHVGLVKYFKKRFGFVKNCEVVYHFEFVKRRCNDCKNAVGREIITPLGRRVYKESPDSNGKVSTMDKGKKKELNHSVETGKQSAEEPEGSSPAAALPSMCKAATI